MQTFTTTCVFPNCKSGKFTSAALPPRESVEIQTLNNVDAGIWADPGSTSQQSFVDTVLL